MPELAMAVTAAPGVTPLRRHPRDVHHPRQIALLQGRQGRRHHGPGPRSPWWSTPSRRACGVRSMIGPPPNRPGVVDHRVQPPAPADGLPHHRRHLLGVGDVAGQPGGRAFRPVPGRSRDRPRRRARPPPPARPPRRRRARWPGPMPRLAPVTRITRPLKIEVHEFAACLSAPIRAAGLAVVKGAAFPRQEIRPSWRSNRSSSARFDPGLALAAAALPARAQTNGAQAPAPSREALTLGGTGRPRRPAPARNRACRRWSRPWPTTTGPTPPR